MAFAEHDSAHHTLSPTQLAGIRAVMQTFVADDLARGVSPVARMYCDTCEGARPRPGFLAYERYQLCNTCATAYEVARARGWVATPGQFVRDSRFGEDAIPPDDDEMDV
jgi:hypothetical protein